MTERISKRLNNTTTLAENIKSIVIYLGVPPTRIIVTPRSRPSVVRGLAGRVRVRRLAQSAGCPESRRFAVATSTRSRDTIDSDAEKLWLLSGVNYELEDNNE